MSMRVAAVVMLAGLAGVALASAPSRSGLDLASLDRSVRPADDLYRFTNGRWLDAAKIPDDRVAFGTFVEIADGIERDLHTIVEDARAATPKTPGSPQQLVGDFYASFMDEARIDALGAAPLATELERIDAITTPREFAAEASYMSSLAIGGPFVPNVITDADDPSRQLIQVAQSGTRLPDRDYYLSTAPGSVEIRRQYEAYLTRILTLVNRPDPAITAHAVLGLETAIARCQLSPVQSRNALLTARETTLSALMVEMPGFDWKAWGRPQALDRYAGIVLVQPAFFKCFASLVPVMPLDSWKAWLVTRHIYQASPYLSRPFREARFNFFGRVLTGQTDVGPRWVSGVTLMNTFLGDALGEMYVKRFFRPEARERAARMTRALIGAYREAIEACDWLSEATRKEASAKLAKTTVGVGHPDRWRDYAGLVITPRDLFGNWQRAHAINSNEHILRSAQPDNAAPGWLRNVQTVNAYYNPALNQILLPAALLQPPVFDLDADDAVNFGALGATIGHELSHAFDERGRRFDADGRIRAWWRPEEEREFARRSQQLVRAFSAFSPAAGLHVDGELTGPENLADLAGLSVAYRAYRASLGGRPAPVIDGFTGEQRFFLSYARMWRMKVRPDYLRQWLLTLPYSPEEFRTNGIVSQLDAFVDVFGVSPGDRLYRDPAERVRLW
jgi:predicted metalloendopeptidase